MQPSKILREYIQTRIAEIKRGAPGFLSDDCSAFMVAGSIGFCCFVSPDGEAFIEEYDFDDVTGREQITRCDRSRRGQIATLVLGTRTHPMLAELLPSRSDDALTCDACAGAGFVGSEIRGIKTKPFRLCEQCCGLGWTSSSVFQ